MRPIVIPRCHKCDWSARPVMQPDGMIGYKCRNPQCENRHIEPAEPMGALTAAEVIAALLPLAKMARVFHELLGAGIHRPDCAGCAKDAALALAARWQAEQPLTPEEAQRAYDAAPEVPLSDERLQEIVDYATKPEVRAQVDQKFREWQAEQATQGGLSGEEWFRMKRDSRPIGAEQPTPTPLTILDPDEGRWREAEQATPPAEPIPTAAERAKELLDSLPQFAHRYRDLSVEVLTKFIATEQAARQAERAHETAFSAAAEEINELRPALKAAEAERDRLRGERTALIATVEQERKNRFDSADEWQAEVARLQALLDTKATATIAAVEKLKADNERLKRGEFTSEEVQDFCHHIDERPGFNIADFDKGCHAYQLALFGVERYHAFHFPDCAEMARLKNDNARLSAHAEALAKQNAALHAELRGTEDQLIEVANHFGAKCGDDLPIGSGDTLAKAIIRKETSLRAQYREWMTKDAKEIHRLRAELAAAQKTEREAIAKLCDAADKSTHPSDLAAMIRARGG